MRKDFLPLVSCLKTVGISSRPHLQNNQSKMDWRYGSSGKVPALQAQSPKLSSRPTKKLKLKKSSPGLKVLHLI
jgi:hypothetical protein